MKVWGRGLRADFSQYIFDGISFITLDLDILRILKEWPDCVDIARIFNLKKKISLIRLDLHKLIYLSNFPCRYVIILNFDKVFNNTKLFHLGMGVKADFCQYIFAMSHLLHSNGLTV